MSYEKVDTDNVLDNLSRIVQDNLGNIQTSTPPSGNQIQLLSQGNKGDSFGQTTGLKSDTPIIANITDQDEDGTPTFVFDRISLSSSLTIVDYIIPIVNIDLRLINFKPTPGTHVKFTPKVGRTLVLKTGGDFDIGTDITVNDGEYLECVFYSELETGITGGGFKPHKTGAAAVGTVTNPMTADLDGGAFDIFNIGTYFLDAALTQGILGNAGGIGIFVPVGDTIDIFINDLVTPKFGFTETSLETNVNLNFANPSSRNITNLGVLGFETTGQSIRSLSSGIRHDVTAPDAHRFRVSTDDKMEVNQFGTTFFKNVELIDNAIFTVFDNAEVNFLQIFQNPLSAAESNINFADTLMFQRAASDIMEINISGLFMPDSKTITLDDLFTIDQFQIAQVLGEAILNYTGTMKITESGADVLTLGGLLIQANKDIDMLNNEINNIFTAEIEENFTAGGVPSRPVNGCKLFVREQFADSTKRELRGYFPTGSSQLIISEP